MMSRPLFRATVLLLVALAAASVVAGCGGGGGSSLSSGIVANVGGEQITQAQLDKVIAQAKNRLEAQGQKIPAAGSQEYQSFQQNALQYLVQKIEFQQQADDLGVKVTDKQVDERLARGKKKFFGGSEKKYKDALAKQKLTDAEVRDELRASLVAEALFKKVGESTKVSAADIQAYYEAHYGQPSREVAHILVKSKALADELYRKAKGGADFAALAKRYSIDKGTGAVGGKYTAVKGQSVPSFDKVAFALRDNEISKPVKSRFGWHVIKALGPVKTTPLKDVKETIRQTLQNQGQQEAVTKWLDELKKKYQDKITYASGFAPPTATTTTTATT
jgi:foldase protein PrsA